ncbi:acid phosphatase [Lysobacter niastensis]|nr:phosphatase PAP2 family protein [Lysobacter niastensis]
MVKSPGKYSVPAWAAIFATGICSAWLAGCNTTPVSEASSSPMLPAPTVVPATPAPVPELKPGVPAGYLGRNLPNSLVLLPAPPDGDSTGFRQDQAVSRASQKLKGTPRYALAASDADLHFPHVASTFDCALGVPVTQQDTPRLYLLLQRTMVDAGLATYTAKDHYKRIRPFVHYKESTCFPADEAALRSDGSYPSGHTSIGWAWALLLTELAPDHADALLARGRSFGESRLVCNAHWQSDILEGRAVAAGAVARLHSDPTFLSDMQAAKAEIDAQRSAGKMPQGDCAAEAEALKTKIPGVL